ncbi:MAG: hypothetical protein ACK4Q4_00625 [Rhodocyclaceae bacterium]
MQFDKAERYAVLNAILALTAFKPARAGEPDKRELGRRSAINGLTELLGGRAKGRFQAEPDSPANVLFAALDHCEAEGMTHAELVQAFNDHAESGRRALQQCRTEARA